jgi:hypothetical protein
MYPTTMVCTCYERVATKQRSKRAATTSQSDRLTLPEGSKRRRQVKENIYEPLRGEGGWEPMQGLVRIPPAPPHMQWGISRTVAPAGTTPIVPSQR